MGARPYTGATHLNGDRTKLMVESRLSLKAGMRFSTLAVAITGDQAPEWIELIPAGRFSAIDGRGPFENSDPDQIVTASVARMPQAGLVLDYDHSTDLAAPRGRPAPAAGWIKELKVERGAIFARIEWTADAAEAVKSKKWRYVSPVFEHDKNGAVRRILRAALTNNPALTELPAIAAARIPVMPRKQLSEILSGLEAISPSATHSQLHAAAKMLMGDDYVGDDGDDEGEGGAPEQAGALKDWAREKEKEHHMEDAQAMAKRHEEELDRCSSEEEKAECSKRHMAETSEARLRAQRAKESATCAQRSEAEQLKTGAQKMTAKEIAELVNKQIATHPDFVAAQKKINEMELNRAKLAATNTVDSAIRAGRLIPAQREWAIEYCTADAEGFQKFIGAQPKILQQGSDGTFTGRIGDAPQGASIFSEKQIEIFTNLGLESKEQLEKCAAVQQKWNLQFPRPRLILDDSNSGAPVEK